MAANIIKEIFSRIVKIEETLVFLSKKEVSTPIIDESVLNDLLQKTKMFEKFISDSLEVRKVTEHIVLLKMESLLEKKLDEAQITSMIERLLDSKLAELSANKPEFFTETESEKSVSLDNKKKKKKEKNVFNLE